MQSTTAFFLLLAAIPCFSQRPFYAGKHPIGYPEVTPGTSDLNNRVGDNLPAQLNGDVAYAKRLDMLPQNQQPFWYLNQKQYAEEQNNPNTWPQRPSFFNENTL